MEQAELDAAVKAQKDKETRALKTANWALAGLLFVSLAVGTVRSFMGRKVTVTSTNNQ